MLDVFQLGKIETKNSHLPSMAGLDRSFVVTFLNVAPPLISFSKAFLSEPPADPPPGFPFPPGGGRGGAGGPGGGGGGGILSPPP